MSTWILLRGLTRESRHWGNFIDVFKEQIADTQVISLDFPGNGRLHQVSSPCSIGAMVEFCRSELREQNISPPYHLLALSLGGMVAVEWAARHSQEVKAAVLINTSMRPFSTLRQRLRPSAYRTLLRLAFTSVSDAQWETEVLRLTSNHVSADEVLNDWVAYRRANPVARSNALRQLLAAARYRAPLRKPVTRLLVLISSRDALVDPQCSRQLATAWQADLAEHSSAGHDLPLDDGDWVARQVRDWLQESRHS
jgi:pimeloyl-ACP methyl ester carboxylesterase